VNESARGTEVVNVNRGFAGIDRPGGEAEEECGDGGGQDADSDEPTAQAEHGTGMREHPVKLARQTAGTEMK